ncbi:MAG: L,D-transpeptidase [Hyphomicrobiales bacterium]
MDRRSFLLSSLALAGMTSGALASGDRDFNFGSTFSPKKTARRNAYRGKEIIPYKTGEKPGTVIVNTAERRLYFVLPDGKAVRYGVGVGRQGFEWSGVARIGAKQTWPEWRPPPEMIERELAQYGRRLPDVMPGGPNNPLGARALYLFQGQKDTLYRIHGTNAPQTIGQAMSSGCIRMLNEEVIDLHDRVKIGAKVIVL